MKNIRIVLLLVICWLPAQSLLAQNNDPSKSDFLIDINNTDNKVVFKCYKGCAWKELSYKSATWKDPIWIDQYGINSTSEQFSSDPSLIEFKFYLAKTEDKVFLKGVKGTAWVNLNFTLPDKEKQAINQLGMTRVEY